MPTQSHDLATVLKALAALREAAHLPPQLFPPEQFIGMISDEIERLRAHGHSDEQIAAIIQQSSGIDLAPATIAEHYATPAQRHRD